MTDADENDRILFIEVKRAIDTGYTLKECAATLGINRTTLWRWLKNCNNGEPMYEQFSVHAVEELIREYIPIFGYACDWGIRMIQARLKREGYKVSLPLVRDALNNYVPGLLASRRRNCLNRRIYDVTEPMELWHMDSYDKLKDFGFRVHGCIDGATHYVLWMKVALNKKASTIYEGYRSTIGRFGHPTCIRADYAVEHIFVAKNLQRARPHTYSYRQGPSVHNQRIEAFWCQLRKDALGYYKRLLRQLSFDEGLLNVDDPLHRCSMVTVMLPFIERAVNDVILTWNAHPVRGIYERGVQRPRHIPRLVFQEMERESKIVLPPQYSDDAIIEVEGTNELMEYIPAEFWTRPNHDTGAFEAGIKDLSDENLRYIRDVTYGRCQPSVTYEKDKLKMHLLLSIECEQCSDAELGLNDYINQELNKQGLSEGTVWCLNALKVTIQSLRD